MTEGKTKETKAENVEAEVKFPSIFRAENETYEIYTKDKGKITLSFPRIMQLEDLKECMDFFSDVINKSIKEKSEQDKKDEEISSEKKEYKKV